MHARCIVTFTQIAKFTWPTWDPPGSCRPHVGPILAPWTLLSGWSCRKSPARCLCIVVFPRIMPRKIWAWSCGPLLSLGIPWILGFMMTSSNGNIFRVTGPLCGEFTGSRWISLTKASDAEFWCFLSLRLNKHLSKQSRRMWFETPLCSLWRHCNYIWSSFICFRNALTAIVFPSLPYCLGKKPKHINNHAAVSMKRPWVI